MALKADINRYKEAIKSQEVLLVECQSILSEDSTNRYTVARTMAKAAKIEKNIVALNALLGN